MHCDDKRTISALKQYIIDATKEMQDLTAQITLEKIDEKKPVIQDRINYLQKSIADSKEQLSEM